MLDIGTILRYYKREEIQKEIIANAKDREVAVKYGESGFGKRPDMLAYPKDILEFVKEGATSFHASEELWKNPFQLEPIMRRQDLDSLRKGWDLVIDIDCHIIEYSKIAADLVIKALKYNGIKSVSCKFSGNKGFHIGIPFEAFPSQINKQETRLLFPEAPRKIASYLKGMIAKPLSKAIMEFEQGDIARVSEKTGKQVNEILSIDSKHTKQLNPEPFLEIDTLLLSSRHLYRMPYSLHEKSGLASIPIDPDKVLEFQRKMASPENIAVSKFRFLDRRNVESSEAKKLIVQGFDSSPKEEKKEESTERKEYVELDNASPLPESIFPPCIKNILKGLEDGKKRSIFVLSNFLSSVNWDYDSIEKRLKVWNELNKPQLREVLLVGNIRYHKQQKKKIPPPNCKSYYENYSVCKPDELCSKIKNPVSYAKKKAFLLKRNEEKPKRRKKED